METLIGQGTEGCVKHTHLNSPFRRNTPTIPRPHRHPGLDPGSMTSALPWIPDQVRDDETDALNMPSAIPNRKATLGNDSVVIAMQSLVACIAAAFG